MLNSYLFAGLQAVALVGRREAFQNVSCARAITHRIINVGVGYEDSVGVVA